MEVCPECGEEETVDGGCSNKGADLGECPTCGWTWELSEPSSAALDRWNARHIY